MHVLNVRDGAKLQAVKPQGDFSFHFSAESLGREVRHFEPPAIHVVGAAAGESSGAKNFVAQRDVVAEIFSRAAPLAAGKSAFATHIDAAGGCQRRTEGFANVQKIQPAAITERPLRIREAGHFRLRVDARAPYADHSLLERKSVAPKRELCGNTGGHWEVTPSGKVHGLPIDCPQVKRTLGCTARVEAETQISTFHGQGRLHIVVENPAVFEFHAAKLQIEKPFTKRLASRGQASRGR